MAKHTIRVNTPYRPTGVPGASITPYSYTPSGCFRGGFSYDLRGDLLYLIHGDGELLLDSGWTGYTIVGFSVDLLTQCPDVKHDCVNGQCVPITLYNTPGQYISLEACEAECGTGNACQAPNICVPPDHCPDGYVCIGADEFAEIKRLLS